MWITTLEGLEYRVTAIAVGPYTFQILSSILYKSVSGQKSGAPGYKGVAVNF